MQVKAIIFDLDGTLLNTLTDLRLSVNFMLEKFGFPIRTMEEIRAFVGNGVKLLVESALPSVKQVMLGEGLPVFKEHYDAHNADNTAPYEGVMEMLASVKKAGLKSAIVSNKYDMAVQKYKDETFTGLIDFAIGEGNGIAPKPAPDGVFKAIEAIGGKGSEDTVYVGDSEVDLLTAKNSGLKCIACSWGFRDRDDHIARGAKHIIDAPSHLLDLIKSGEIL